MVKMGSTRVRWIAAGGALALVTAVFVSAVVAGQFVAQDPSSFEADLATGTVMRVADIAAADGLSARGVFARVTDGGQLCLWDAPSADSRLEQGGCNSLSDPLGGSTLSASLAYEGGPAAADVKDARLIGLTAPAVASIRVLMSDGTYRLIGLGSTRIQGHLYGAFAYRFRRADLRRGVGPVAVLALNRSGTEVGRQLTGIGG